MCSGCGSRARVGPLIESDARASATGHTRRDFALTFPIPEFWRRFVVGSHTSARRTDPFRQGPQHRPIGLGLVKRPRWDQRVTLIPRDHVQMEVEYRLPSRRATRVHEVDPIWGQGALNHACNVQGCGHGSLGIFCRHVPHIPRMSLWDHKNMAFRRRMKVHDRHDGLVFIHAL